MKTVELQLRQMTVDPTIGAWIAMFDGKQITTPSKKSSWKEKRHAKLAVRNALAYRSYKDEGFYSAAEACQHYEEIGLLTYKKIN